MYHLLVYGTLRTTSTDTVLLPGTLHDLGSYPGLILDGASSGNFVVCEKAVVPDIRPFDLYEGYDERSETSSLYLRRKVEVEGSSYYVYEYNYSVSSKTAIPSGDWLVHTKTDKGSAHRMTERAQELAKASLLDAPNPIPTSF